MPSCDLRETSLSKDSEAPAGAEPTKYHFGKQAGIGKYYPFGFFFNQF